MQPVLLATMKGINVMMFLCVGINSVVPNIKKYTYSKYKLENIKYS